MKLVYRCRSGQAAHQWIRSNKHDYETHLTVTGNRKTIVGMLECSWHTMGVVCERARVVDNTGEWAWADVYSVYHSENDGGGRPEINLVNQPELRA